MMLENHNCTASSHTHITALSHMRIRICFYLYLTVNEIEISLYEEKSVQG